MKAIPTSGHDRAFYPVQFRATDHGLSEPHASRISKCAGLLRARRRRIVAWMCRRATFAQVADLAGLLCSPDGPGWSDGVHGRNSVRHRADKKVRPP
jgi:hypothetical protein